MPLPDFPPVIDALASIIIVVVAGVLAKLGLTKPNAANPPPATPTDAVVVSAAFADGKPLRDLNQRLGNLDDTLSTLNRCTRLNTEEQERTTDATTRLADHVHQLKELLEDRLPRTRPPAV